jgi:general secretion pathway protein G
VRAASALRPMPRSRGFTLLEILVVLTLIALATGLVAPRFVTFLESANRADADRQFVAAFARLPVAAYTRRQEMSFASNAVADAAAVRPLMPPPHLALPPGWGIRFDRPLTVTPLGVCSDAQGLVFTPEGSRKFSVTGPDCRAVLGP